MYKIKVNFERVLPEKKKWIFVPNEKGGFDTLCTKAVMSLCSVKAVLSQLNSIKDEIKVAKNKFCFII